MKITRLSNIQREVVRDNFGLDAYLSSLAVGKPETPRSWLYDSISTQEVLDRWLAILKRLQTGTSFEREVFTFDTTQLSKWGPQGGVPPISEIFQQVVEPTFSQSERDIDERSVQFDRNKDWYRSKVDAVSWFRQFIRDSSLRAKSVEHVGFRMDSSNKLYSNSGWPDFTRRKNLDTYIAAVSAASTGLWEKYPAIALFRNYNQKTRLVWMFPMATNLFEGTLTQPIEDALMSQSIPFFSPWEGFGAVRQLISTAYDESRFLYATDFSSTDANFGYAATSQVGALIANWFNSKDIPALHKSLCNLHSIPLVTGDDQIVKGRHGVASGSMWTNLLETLFDRIFAFYVERKTQYQMSGACAIGDDLLWMSSDFNDAFPQQAEACAKDVGLDTNAEKVTAFPDKVKYLQRLFQRGYKTQAGLTRGVYPTIRALKSSVFPERFHKSKDWSPDMFCVRQFMILENCVDHPLFEEFVKFVVAGNKHLLPFAKRNDSAIDQAYRKSRMLAGLNPTYTQERKGSSLAEFESIKLARKL